MQSGCIECIKGDMIGQCINKLRWVPHAYNLLWTTIYWVPYFVYLRTEHMNQLTWWCWTFQSIFYTINHFQYNPIWSRPRLFMNLDNNRVVDGGGLCMVYGAVNGIVWFVFFGFCFVIFYNPSLVCERSESEGGYVSLVNILIHYYIVTGIMLWTIYRMTWLQYQMIKFIETRKQYITFGLSWTPIVFGYLCYWKFDFNGIIHNYHLNDVPEVNIVIYFILNAIMCIKANLMIAYLTQHA